MVLKRRYSLLLFAAFSILMSVFAFFFGFNLYSDFKDTRNTRLKNNSYLLGEWINDSFKSSEYLLMNIVNQVPLENIEYPPTDMKRYYLYKDLIEESMLSFPYAAFSGIIDRNGILSHSNSVDGFDLSSREFFLEMKNHPDRKSILSNAFKSPEGYYYVVHGLNYEKNDSEFKAMAVIGVSLDFFTVWIEKLDYEGSGRISIIDKNGTLLAHNFDDKSIIGGEFADFDIKILNLDRVDFQTGSIKSAEGSGKRFFAVREIDNLPFYIIIEEEDSIVSSLFFPMAMIILGIIVTVILAIVALRSQLSLINMHTELENTSSELKTLFNHSMVGISLIDSNRYIRRANPRFAEIAGYDSPEAAEGRDILKMHISDDNYRKFGAYYIKEFKKGSSVDIEYEFRRTDGKHIWLRTFGKAIDNKIPPDLSKGIIWIIDDITERREAREKLREMAITDPLTRINNRRHFMILAEREFSIFNRCSRPITVLMLDIDNFKTINDSYGHSTGDLALIHFAEICVQNLRTGDIFGRIGGEEFAAVLPDTEIDAAFRVADRIRQKTETTSVPNLDIDIRITVSIGAAAAESSPAELSDILKKADKALFKAKNDGRNKVIRYFDDKEA